MHALCLRASRSPDAGLGQSLHLADTPKHGRYSGLLFTMNVLVFFAVLAFSLQMRNSLEQRRRVLFLGRYLRRYQIESLMQSLVDGYLRAMGEQDMDRRQSIWSMLTQTETQICEQFQSLLTDLADANPRGLRASTLPLSLPFATRWFPGATFDLRDVLMLHGEGIARMMRNAAGLSERDRSYCMVAELLLMQHSCHWFCKSRWIASARMLARHQTSHEQLLEAVSAPTRSAYRKIMGI